MDGHVRLDDGGVAYVGETRLKLIHLVMAYGEEGGSVAGLREVYDWLPEADLYGALAYYLDHQEEVDRAIQEYHRISEEFRLAAGDSPLTAKLRENRRA